MAADGLLSDPQDRAARAEGSDDAPSAPSAELPLATLLVVASLAAALVAQGGYYRPGQRLAAALLAAAAVIGLRNGPLSTVARRPIVRVAAALAAWSVVSAALAGDLASAASTVLVLAGAVAVVLTCAHLDLQQRDQLAVVVVGLGLAVALSGWAGWRGTGRRGGWRIRVSGGRRPSSPTPTQPPASSPSPSSWPSPGRPLRPLPR